MSIRLTQAERRQRTCQELVAAADSLFRSQGFHATSLDQIAAAAGYTKGAIYFNFDSKEDLFFAVYERRAADRRQEFEGIFRRADPVAALERLGVDALCSMRRDDGWIAVFFEFWAHVLRDPALTKRFAELHASVSEPFVSLLEAIAEERRIELPLDARPLATAVYAMQLGLQLERLTQPDVVDEELGVAMSRLVLESLGGMDGG